MTPRNFFLTAAAAAFMAGAVAAGPAMARGRIAGSDQDHAPRLDRASSSPRRSWARC